MCGVPQWASARIVGRRGLGSMRPSSRDEQAAVTTVLEVVQEARLVGAAPLPGPELRGRVGKVDLAVGRHVEVIGVEDGLAVGLGGEHGDLAVGRDFQEPAEGVRRPSCVDA